MNASRRRLATIAFAWIAIGVTWAAGIGRYGGPDEPAHVLRAYAVAHGEVQGVAVESLPSGYRAVVVPRSLGTGDPTCYRHDPTLTSACSVPAPGTGTVLVATSAGVAPPLYYALVGVPARLVGGADDPFVYRLSALAWLVLVLVLAARRAGPLGRAAIAMVVLVPPSAWFLLGVVNPNSLEVAAAALAWVGVARAQQRGVPDAIDLLWIGMPLGLAVAMRPIAAVAAVAVGTVLSVDPRSRPGWRGQVVLWGPSAIGGVNVLAWQRMIRWDGTDPRTATAVSTWTALRDSAGGLPRTAGELVGTTGWLELSLPIAVKAAWILLAAGVAARVTVAIRARTRTARDVRVRAGTSAARVWAVWAVILAGTPVVFETAFTGSIGPIWQGRYSLPVFVGMGALVVADRARHLRVLVVGAVAVEAAAYVATVRRYAVGTDGSWLLHHTVASTRVLTPTAWVLVHLGLAVVIGAWLWRAVGSEHVAEHVDDDVGVARVVEHGELPAGSEFEVGLVGHGHPGSRVHRRRRGASHT